MTHDVADAYANGKKKLLLLALFLGLALLVPVLAHAEPQIWFRHVPEYGSFDDLKGKVSGVKRKKYRVAVYIEVFGGWWTKPTFAQPVVKINKKKKWKSDITTGGFDAEATTIAAFLIPKGYSPPLLAGVFTLPNELDENAVAQAMVSRPVTP
ncbi:MAG: hypothetical protein HYZ50_15195 [Deltaproteobacteria bacterium]|nr:hypothetical protein [Deltaproteobacteria bacterium]